MNERTGLRDFLNAATGFAIGVVFSLVLYPSLSKPQPSTILKVDIVNTTDDLIQAAIFLPDGTVAGSPVEAGGEAELTIFEGELIRPGMLESMRVVIVDDGLETILNQKYAIEIHERMVVSRVVSFKIGETMVDGEPEKTIEFVIEGRASP